MALATFSPNKGYANFSTLVYPTVTPTSLTVTSSNTPLTATVTQILNGLVIVDCQDAGTLTLPTAALLKAAIAGAQAYNAFQVHIRNSGDSTLTIAAGTGGTISGTDTIATANAKTFLVVFTDTDAGEEAYTAYSLGTVVF